MSRIKYYSRVLAGQDLKSVRYHMIRYALAYGIKPTARLFGTTPRTVRKWIERWRANPLDFPTDARHTFKVRKSRINAGQKRIVLQLKARHPKWGALKIKQYYKLELSDKAIRKIWKEHIEAHNDQF